MKFTDKLLKRSLINDVEIYPNFFSNIWKVPNQNKLFILIIWNNIQPTDLYGEIKRKLKDYQIKFVTPLEMSKYLLKYKPYSITYNGFNFDDPLVKYLIKNPNNKNLLKNLYSIAQWAIKKEGKGKYLYSKHKYDKSFPGIDVQRVSGLDRIYKPLKLAAANLRHSKIQDLPIKPGSVIKKEEIVNIITYGLNDVIITEKILTGIPTTHNSPIVPKTAYNGLLGAIDFRYEIGKMLEVDLMNSNNSQLGEKIVASEYSKISGLKYEEFKSTQTKRNFINYSDIIFNWIQFKTPQMIDFLNHLKTLVYEPFNDSKSHKKQFKFEFDFYNCKVVFAQGGIHGTHKDKILTTSKKKKLKDVDGASFYPFIYWKHKVEPKHLPNFSDFAGGIIKLRVSYKKTNKVYANGLKIGINRIYGGFSDIHGWLYDVQALLKTTINGQLMLMMLAEEYEINGIETFYYNTDGLSVICDDDKYDKFLEINKRWEALTLMVLEETNFIKAYVRDVNNFIILKEGDNIKLKGAYEYSGYIEKYGEFNLNGSFTSPIVSYATVQYFTKGIPIKETISNHLQMYPEDGIYDFCIAKKANKQFTNQLFEIYPDKIEVTIIQRSVRYYISNSNTKLFKVKSKTDRELLGLLKKSQSKRNNLDYIYFLSENKPDFGLLIKHIENKGYFSVMLTDNILFKNPKVEWKHYDELEAGRNITLFNDYFKSEDYDIDYSYYISEAQKLIDGIEKNKTIKKNDTNQLKLF